MPSHATADLLAPVELTEAEIRERMSGNLCRCAAYPNIVAAILDAGKWIDAGLQNKMKMAETVADKSYVNTDKDVIESDLGKLNLMNFDEVTANSFQYLIDGSAALRYATNAIIEKGRRAASEMLEAAVEDID